MKNNFREGFTLIELLVVVAIIGILSTFVLSNLGAAKSKSRDTTRKQNLDQIVKAISLYYSQIGDIPGATSECIDVTNAAFTAFLTPTFIKDIPNDPSNPTSGTSGNYVYENQSDSTGKYRLCASVENTNAGNITPAISVCGGSAVYNYCVNQ
jgi:prepilin-type N-terminal cleavage/methylation domain-containing protein